MELRSTPHDLGSIIDKVNNRWSEEQNQQLPRKRANSRFRGVYKSGRKWKASIQIGGKYIYLGTFNSELDAALTYDIRARKAFGDDFSNFDQQGKWRNLKHGNSPQPTSMTTGQFQRKKRRIEAFHEANETDTIIPPTTTTVTRFDQFQSSVGQPLTLSAMSTTTTNDAFSFTNSPATDSSDDSQQASKVEDYFDSDDNDFAVQFLGLRYVLEADEMLTIQSKRDHLLSTATASSLMTSHLADRISERILRNSIDYQGLLSHVAKTINHIATNGNGETVSNDSRMFLSQLSDMLDGIVTDYIQLHELVDDNANLGKYLALVEGSTIFQKISHDLDVANSK